MQILLWACLCIWIIWGHPVQCEPSQKDTPYRSTLNPTKLCLEAINFSMSRLASSSSSCHWYLPMMETSSAGGLNRTNRFRQIPSLGVSPWLRACGQCSTENRPCGRCCGRSEPKISYKEIQRLLCNRTTEFPKRCPLVSLYRLLNLTFMNLISVE